MQCVFQHPRGRPCNGAGGEGSTVLREVSGNGHVEGGAQHPRGHLIAVRMVSKAKQTNTNLQNIILTGESMNMFSKGQDQERSSFNTSIWQCTGELANAIGQAGFRLLTVTTSEAQLPIPAS